ncbi:MAG: hypothetical protein ACI9VM_000369 [Candidatus Azotimanducaceae bacterium]|jgi:hypothetical protein
MPKNVTKQIVDSVETIEKTVEDFASEADSLVEPVRKSVFKRFPALFTILVTFGVAATFFGFEQILASSTYLSERPFLILTTGLIVLLGTGKLYKKLG